MWCSYFSPSFQNKAMHTGLPMELSAPRASFAGWKDLGVGVEEKTKSQTDSRVGLWLTQGFIWTEVPWLSQLMLFLSLCAYRRGRNAENPSILLCSVCFKWTQRVELLDGSLLLLLLERKVGMHWERDEARAVNHRADDRQGLMIWQADITSIKKSPEVVKH